MGKENEIIRPQSRLDANTVAASRAVDAQRAAVNAERQGMQTERSLQRKYRRAVRKDDFAAAADIAKTLALTGGTTVGPVIRKAEEERMVAGQRAIDRASLQEKIRNGGDTTPLPGDPRAVEGEGGNPPPKVDAKGQEGADEVAGQAAKTANPNATAGAGRGKSIKKDGSETVGDKNEAPDAIEAATPPPPPKVASGGNKKSAQQPIDDLESFADDLKRSKLVNSGDSAAIERAVKRGEGLGASREQTLYEIDSNKRSSIPTLASLPPDEQKALPVKPKDTLKEIGDILSSVKPSAPSIYGPQGTDKQTPDFVSTPVSRVPSEKKETVLEELDPKSAEYWNVEIRKAIESNVDISGFTRQDLKFHSAYLKAKESKALLNEAYNSNAQIASKVDSLLSN